MQVIERTGCFLGKYDTVEQLKRGGLGPVKFQSSFHSVSFRVAAFDARVEKTPRAASFGFLMRSFFAFSSRLPSRIPPAIEQLPPEAA